MIPPSFVEDCATCNLGEEYELLKPDLVRVQESLGNFAFANEVKQTSFKDAFFKVSALAATEFTPGGPH